MSWVVGDMPRAGGNAKVWEIWGIDIDIIMTSQTPHIMDVGDMPRAGENAKVWEKRGIDIDIIMTSQTLHIMDVMG